MTHTILNLAHALAMSANITAQEVETVARWQEDAGLIEPLGIDTDAFQHALEFGDETLPEGARTILIAGLVEGLHVVLVEGHALRQVRRNRGLWLLRRVGLTEGSPFAMVRRLLGLSREGLADALGVSVWQSRMLSGSNWADVARTDHDQALARLGVLWAAWLEGFEGSRSAA